MGYLRGRVQHILFQASSYYVFKFKVEDTDFPYRDSSTTVSGHLVGIPGLKAGATIHMTGEWINHAKWGRQFSPRGWLPWAATTRDIESFLDLSLAIGGATITEEIVKAFGLDTFDVFTQRPEAIIELAKDDKHRDQLHHAVQVWESARGLSNLSVFLQDYGLGPETVAGIYAKFGSEAQDIISKNPYRLVVVSGFTFGRADALASRLDIPRNDPRRVEGAVLWSLKEEAREGHLYMRRGELPERMNSLIEKERVDPFGIDNLYRAAMTAGAKLVKEGGLCVDSTVGVYLPDLFLFERESAKKLATFLTPSEIDIDLDEFLENYEKSNQMELSEAQRDAAAKLISNRVLVVTGLPGTGKTTLVRTFVRLFKDAGIRCMLMAPTGIAAKRLSAVTEEDAQTIHRALGYNGTEWAHDTYNKLTVGAVIVDEMSMVDQELIYRLLTALDPSTILVMVGDDAQLPSVGPGNVLREMVSCPDLPHIRLSQIYRQAHTSEIVLASHKINSGHSPLSDERDPDSEFQFVAVSDEDKIVDLIVAMAVKLKARDANFQVLSPKHGGAVGVSHLNERLRDKLNPGGLQREWKSGSLSVREGDRLMVVKNNYKLNISNGDMGKLIAINKDSLLVRIHGVGRTPDQMVHISKDMAPMTLRLAYAVTVHKSQGSEFDTIIMPIVRSQGRMLQRNLFYTAVTRARQKVWLLGDSEGVGKAVANDRVIQRNTVLGRAISEAVAELSGVGVDHGHSQETSPRAVDG